MRLDKKKLKQLRYDATFEVVRGSIEQLNPEFSYCTVLVAYHGDNRNRSSIAKDVFDRCLWTIYGIPIVGEWVRPEEDPSKETWGTHGGRIILDSEGIRYEQTTKPFGFVTEEAYRNAKWVKVLEKDGHTEHEYLKLEKCILWNGRYEECNSILDENFGQSMELNNLEGHYREDGYFEITDFSFSALCILGTAEPCFESAMIGRQYELSQFKQEVQKMMDAYKQYATVSEPASVNPKGIATEVVPVVEGTGEGSAAKSSGAVKHENNENKEVKSMSEINFADVVAKVQQLVTERKYESSIGKQYAKYIMLSVREADMSVFVVDREDGYKAYRLPYVATQTEAGLVVNIDYEKMVPQLLGAVETTEAGFDVGAEVSMMAEDTVAYNVKIHTNSVINDLTDKLNTATVELKAAHAKIGELDHHLGVFEREKKQFMEQKHRDIIDTLIASRREEMPKDSEFLTYCVHVDYSKSVDTVKAELKEIHYNFLQKNQPGANGRKQFSSIEVPVMASKGTEGSAIAKRYGQEVADLLARFE